jgi:hypothetical protein
MPDDVIERSCVSRRKHFSSQIFGKKAGGDGSPGRTRTSDPAINSRLLYQLSYWGSPRSGSTHRRPVDGDAYIKGLIRLPSPSWRFFHQAVIFLWRVWKTPYFSDD